MGFQETYLANDCHTTLKPYNCISKQGIHNRRYHGGIALFVHESCPYEEIELNSQYQIIAATVHIGQQNAVTFANIYILGSAPLDFDELCRITNYLPKPAVILGDFNARETDWENRHTDSRGRVIEQYIDRQQLNMLNNGAPTHISGTASDLTITFPKVTPHCGWQEYESVLNSDHFPIIPTIAIPPSQTEPGNNFNYKKANWQEYSLDKVWKKLPGEEQRITVDTLVENFYTRLYTAAENHIPRYILRRHYPKPWWSGECTRV